MLIWVSVKSTEGVAATALETSQSHTLSARAASIRSCRPASLVRSWRLDRLHKHGTFWYRLLGSIFFFFFFMHHRLLLLPGGRITRTASLLENRLRIALGAQSQGGWTPEKATEVLTHHRSLGRTLRARLLLRSLQIHIRSLPIYLYIYLSLSLSTCWSICFFVYRTSLLSSLALSKARIGTSKQAAATSAKQTQSCCCCWKNERVSSSDEKATKLAPFSRAKKTGENYSNKVSLDSTCHIQQQQQQQASEDDPFLPENTRPCPQRHPEEASGPCRRCRRPLVFFLVVFFSAQTPSPLLFLLLFFFFIFFILSFSFPFFSQL